MVGEVVPGASALDVVRPELFSVVNSTSAHDRQELHCVAETSVGRGGGEGRSQAVFQNGRKFSRIS
jgi:hypothetical protein